MKKLLRHILIVVLILSVTLPVNAAAPPQSEPQYTYIKQVTSEFAIDTSGTATCTGTISVNVVKPVKVVCELQIYIDGGWQTLSTWEASGTSSATVTKTRAVYCGYSYRVYATGYVYNSSGIQLEEGFATSYANY